MKKHPYKNTFINKSPAIRRSVIIIICCLLSASKLFAQTPAVPSDSSKVQLPATLKVNALPKYPQVVGYLSFIVPVVSVNKNGTTSNFNGTTRIGFPIGINIFYSDKFGFSYEFAPTIASGNGTSKVNNFLFGPGTIFRFQHGLAVVTRLAFETSGRYGFTPVVSKVFLSTKYVNYFTAVSAPARFGNNDPSSIGLNIQVGFIFH